MSVLQVNQSVKSFLSAVRFIPVILIMGIIFLLSHQTGSSLDFPKIPFVDKLAHCFLYGVLAIAAIYALPIAQKERKLKRTGVFVILFCLLYGITDEFHQSFIPGRFSSVSDLFADTIGATMTVIWWVRH